MSTDPPPNHDWNRWIIMCSASSSNAVLSLAAVTVDTGGKHSARDQVETFLNATAQAANDWGRKFAGLPHEAIVDLSGFEIKTRIQLRGVEASSRLQAACSSALDALVRLTPPPDPQPFVEFLEETEDTANHLLLSYS